MTYVHNEPSDFVEQALTGFALAHADLVRRVDGGVVRAGGTPEGHVALVVGGGSGHYPAFAGVVGHGLAAGAVCGEVFTSPAAGAAHRVATTAQTGAGVLFSYGNYAGDVLHFGEAQERLLADGIDCRTVLVTDDIASGPPERAHERRGIAGDVVVFKVAGAAAERGDDLDEVERLARLANDRTRTLGVAFAGCTFPGADEPLFTVPEGMMSIGLGIHGEPGIEDVPAGSADEIARLLVAPLLDDVPADRGDRAVLLVNGLGAVKYEELYVLLGSVARLLQDAGVTIVQPECGELVTSLDMAGASVTLCWLTPELEELWAAPALTPAFRKGGVGGAAASVVDVPSVADVVPSHAADADDDVADEESQAAAARAVELLDTVHAMLREHEDELGRIDAAAGDGDHGVGMRRGSEGAVEAARAHTPGGLRAALLAAGDAWSERGGGTSGALWGAGLAALGQALADDDAGPGDPGAVARAVRAGLDRITTLGKAQVGDKTMVDALVPYADRLQAEVEAGTPLPQALTVAAQAATESATATAELTPRLGRARPLAERSVGHPDAGATSLALVVTTVAEQVGGTTEQDRQDEQGETR